MTAFTCVNAGPTLQRVTPRYAPFPSLDSESVTFSPLRVPGAFSVSHDLQKQLTNPLSVASTGLPELSVGTLLGVSGETENSRA